MSMNSLFGGPIPPSAQLPGLKKCKQCQLSYKKPKMVNGKPCCPFCRKPEPAKVERRQQ